MVSLAHFLEWNGSIQYIYYDADNDIRAVIL
jgi:hypothetical protein